MHISSRTTVPAYDWVGIVLSTVCLIHCLLVPVLVAIAPFVGVTFLTQAWLENEWFHLAMLVPVFLVSGVVLGRRARRNALIGWLAALGLGAMLAGVSLGNELAEQLLTGGGAVLLVSAHIVNLRSHKPIKHTRPSIK
ncbi:MerC domain-containing protein [Pseudoblastomonas halimionae]|uniref:MerC family mercury resistance protein n=1 Tax=Alteriqipengyuania halimionae TaxID=1926630 RepID=A0A6I4U3U7_9SPHN|nr:MerC domain-containing protein [Alteriqipengyuania halimionae]MXP10034.1 MerC family mercury resistance protein [Alteriqipengyuania halimionae]